MLVPPGLARDALEALIAHAAHDLRAADYVRNEMVESAHGRRLADVVFMFVYQDVTQQPFANWIARAIWVSGRLPQSARPNVFGQQTLDPELSIDWNESYPTIAEFVASKATTKGSYLRLLDSFSKGLPAVLDEARRMVEAKSITGAEEGRLAELARMAELLPRPDPMLIAPYELSELDSVFAEVDALLGNLFLPFGDRGQATWSEPERRLWLARDALRHLDDALLRLQYERKKVR